MNDLLLNETVIAAAGLMVAILVAVWTARAQATLARNERIANLKRETYSEFISAFHGAFRHREGENHRLVEVFDRISLIASPEVAIASKKFADLMKHNSGKEGNDISQLDSELTELLRLMRSELSASNLSPEKWEKMRVRFYDSSKS